MNSPRSQLYDLDDRALMSAAGELSVRDGREVDQGFAAGDDFAARLAEAESLLARTAAAFAAVDDASLLDPNRAAGRASEAVGAWQRRRVAAAGAVAVDDRQPRRWVVPAAVAAGVAIVAGGVALKSRVDQFRVPVASGGDSVVQEVPGGTPPDDPLVLNAATTLVDLSATAGEDEAGPPADPMPPEPRDEPIASPSDGPYRPFFDVPLVADVDGSPPP